MHSGDAVMPMSIVSVGVLVLIGIVYLLFQSDQRMVFEEAGNRINGITERQLAGFWGCALPDVNLEREASAENLKDQISNRAIRDGADYADHVRSDCLRALSILDRNLGATAVPETFRDDVDAMKVSARRLAGSWTDYLSYLEGSGTAYNENTAEPLLVNIAREWQAFNSANASFNRKLEQELK